MTCLCLWPSGAPVTTDRRRPSQGFGGGALPPAIPLLSKCLISKPSRYVRAIHVYLVDNTKVQQIATAQSKRLTCFTSHPNFTVFYTDLRHCTCSLGRDEIPDKPSIARQHDKVSLNLEQTPPG